jgi:hypothetical protein
VQRNGVISLNSTIGEGVLSFRIAGSAEARWQGTVPEGSGQISLGSGVFARLAGGLLGELPATT